MIGESVISNTIRIIHLLNINPGGRQDGGWDGTGALECREAHEWKDGRE